MYISGELWKCEEMVTRREASSSGGTHSEHPTGVSYLQPRPAASPSPAASPEDEVQMEKQSTLAVIYGMCHTASRIRDRHHVAFQPRSSTRLQTQPQGWLASPGVWLRWTNSCWLTPSSTHRHCCAFPAEPKYDWHVQQGKPADQVSIKKAAMCTSLK